MIGKVIQFLRAKDFKFIREIGQGGTGRTVLLKDELINEQFVCKKYSPFYKEHKQEFYSNFKEEIKLLHLLYHNNIVRVFNYYLYPEEFTGYILMEYIEGSSISEFLKENPDKLNHVFTQTIAGFEHLEKSQILHRDIRPDNIIVANDGTVKIIDFGFSKQIEFESDFDKSISLNWMYEPPNEFANKTYDFRTEVYFVGKLFEQIITDNNFRNFAYKDQLKQMILSDYDKRTSSFFNVGRSIIGDGKGILDFTEVQKSTYREFADGLIGTLSNIQTRTTYRSDIDQILSELRNVYNNSILEEVIQNSNSITKCFIDGNYRYWKSREIKVETLKNFIDFIDSISKEKRKIVINNLWQRLDQIQRHDPDLEADDLPF